MNPLLLDFPLQMNTERLILRAPLQSGDEEIVNEAIKDSFNELKSVAIKKIPGSKIIGIT
ncbi:hypothetical protein [Fictibacillus phosphorivorans]|uniref:hypothetical protein n=1 Tax=Fictibacillus phosphorivorans TaxID=1221500 RepID=UPI001D17254A|nr:hypothetical protein [Fictibacillus phosphorivorans]